METYLLISIVVLTLWGIFTYLALYHVMKGIMAAHDSINKLCEVAKIFNDRLVELEEEKK